MDHQLVIRFKAPQQRNTYAFGEARRLDQGQHGRVAGDLASDDTGLATNAGIHLGEDDGADVSNLDRGRGVLGGGARLDLGHLASLNLAGFQFSGVARCGTG